MTGDWVLFHAVIHARLFAAGQILDPPQYDTDDPEWGLRFPWTFHVRVDIWVPLISDAPKTSDIAAAKALGQIQRGAYYVKLAKQEYDRLLAQISAVSSSRARRGA